MRLARNLIGREKFAMKPIKSSFNFTEKPENLGARTLSSFEKTSQQELYVQKESTDLIQFRIRNLGPRGEQVPLT